MARILIVDDDESLRETMRIILAAAGHEVAEEADGRLVEQTAVAWRPDLIVIDLRMPGRDGLETIQGLRSSGVQTPIIAMTGVAPDLFDAATRLGAGAVLEKPFAAAALRAVVDSLLPPRRA